MHACELICLELKRKSDQAVFKAMTSKAGEHVA